VNTSRVARLCLLALATIGVPGIFAQTNLPLDLDAYVERVRKQFEVPGISLAIVKDGGGLVMKLSHSPVMTGDVQHWQYDTFVVRWRDRELRADAFVTFALTAEGEIDRATMKAVSDATDFSYDFQDLLLRRAPAQKK
jgi:hypothetical protein